MCSACLKKGFCSSECQKTDWKIHKIMCSHMKNAENYLSFEDLNIVLKKLLSEIFSKKLLL